MRKLVIGIAVVALLALTVVPAMAYLDQEPVSVQITVDAYGVIEFSPAMLEFNVEGPYDVDPVPAPYCDDIDFTVLCNLATTLTVTSGAVSQAIYDPEAGYYYPTAAGIGNASGHRIGFGVVLKNLATNESCPWIHDTHDDARAEVSFGASQTSDPDKNANLYVVTYMDSARDSDLLVPAGVYEATLWLTLTAG